MKYLSFTLAFFATISFADDNGNSGEWPVAGQSPLNWRSQPDEKKINPINAAQLSVKWTYTTTGDVSATPTVFGDAVYFPDWGGSLNAVRKSDGRPIWTRQISTYDQQPGAISRVSPAIYADDLILGDLQSANKPHSGANIFAVNRNTGALHWITKVDDHPAAIITGPPVVSRNTIYVGVSSNEEGLATDPNYPCCSFRGSMVALDARTGRMLWKTYMAPEGYSGNAIWQPPAILEATDTLFVGTGNNYEVPEQVKTCIANSTPEKQPSCFADNDYFDSALAISTQTGQVRWSRRLQGVDVWTVACNRNPNPVSCPLPSSPDYDLGGSGPNLLPNMVGFGQKSGIYWALNPASGDILWSTVVGPGATLGGIEWGTATDGRRIYVAITNSKNKSYPLINGETITWGAWSALDATNGHILWQTADPDHALAMGSVSVANGVLYAPSYSGAMHAIDAQTGYFLWSFQSGGSVLDGPAIVDGTVYWGSGYKKIAPGTPNNKIYAFSLEK